MLRFATCRRSWNNRWYQRPDSTVRRLGRHGGVPVRATHNSKIGTRGRTRTGTGFTPTDFESVVSTNFTTLAQAVGTLGILQ